MPVIKTHGSFLEAQKYEFIFNLFCGTTLTYSANRSKYFCAVRGYIGAMGHATTFFYKYYTNNKGERDFAKILSPLIHLKLLRQSKCCAPEASLFAFS
jgi:hypothetical protein